MGLPPLPESARPTSGLSREEGFTRLGGALAEYPLYRKFKITAPLWSFGYGSTHPYLSTPPMISLHCRESGCEKALNWIRVTESGSRSHIVQSADTEDEAQDFATVTYQCRNCSKSRVTYYVLMSGSGEKIEMTKVGQWPPLSRDVDQHVTAGWSAQDLKLYQDGLTLRHHGAGIGAMPYLRRIIETHVHDIARLVEENNRISPIPNFEQAKLDAARESRSFTRLLDTVKDYLPANISVAGQPNPLQLLHEHLSLALHQKSEEECIDIFDACKAAFEFVIRRLTDSKREAETYRSELQKLTKIPPR